jgi:hypothetical protein
MGFLNRFRKPKTTVKFEIPRDSISLGSTISASITVSSKEEFDASEVRAELRCIEKRRRERWVYNKRLRRDVRHVYWDSATLLSEDLKASGPIHIVPGFRKKFPIEVNIPSGGRETLDGIDANVSWFIKGVVAVDDRPDPTSETFELQIFRSATPTTKEEMKMVKCEYCSSLMPANSSSCPICGAPRKN